MNEKDVQRESKKIFLIMLLIFCLLGFILKSLSYPIGVIVGYMICYINFILTIQSSDIILKEGHHILLIILMFLSKLILMTLGFLSAILFKDYIHLLSVFFGYLITPITIQWLNLKTRKELK